MRGGSKRSNGKKWTAAEDAILRQHYEHAPKAELLRLLPGRSWPAILGRAYKLEGISRPDPGVWTPREIQILKQHYHTATKKQLLRMLPGRTWQAARVRAGEIGLTSSTYYRARSPHTTRGGADPLLVHQQMCRKYGFPDGIRRER